MRNSENGRVIEILGTPGGLAEVDSDGDGFADELLGMTTEERAQLAALYAPGKTLWRVVIPHFDDPWDINWGFAPPDDAEPPDLPPPSEETNIVGACLRQGSLIECQNQTLREHLPIVGTPFELHYASDRVPGRGASVEVEVPLSGDSVPASLESIELRVSIAGRDLVSSYAPLPNQSATIVWDRRDVYGRILQGAQAATVRVGYVYRGVYQQVERFGYKGNGLKILGSRTRQVVVFPQEFHLRVGGFDARGQGLGGWDLDVHQVYDPLGRTLFGGDGERRTEVDALGATIETFAGNGEFADNGDGGPARAAAMREPRAAVVGADDSVYVVTASQRVRRIDADGIISTITTHNPACYAPCPTSGGIDMQEVCGMAVDERSRLLGEPASRHSPARRRRRLANGTGTSIGLVSPVTADRRARHSSMRWRTSPSGRTAASTSSIAKTNACAASGPTDSSPPSPATAPTTARWRATIPAGWKDRRPRLAWAPD